MITVNEFNEYVRQIIRQDRNPKCNEKKYHKENNALGPHCSHMSQSGKKSLNPIRCPGVYERNQHCSSKRKSAHQENPQKHTSDPLQDHHDNHIPY